MAPIEDEDVNGNGVVLKCLLGEERVTRNSTTLDKMAGQVVE